MAKETTTFSLWEKLQAVYEKKSSPSKLILIKQLFNMKMRETNPATSHINTFSRVLSELSSQGINFEEEVKALALLSSLPASWEVFCTTYANSRPILNLDETTGQVLTKDIKEKSMGLAIDESAEAHHSTELFDRQSRTREQADRTGRNTNRSKAMGDQQRLKSRMGRSREFYTHSRKVGHNVSDC